MKEKVPEQYDLFPKEEESTAELQKIMVEMLREPAYKNLSLGDPVLKELAELRLAWRKSGQPAFVERDHMLE